MSEAEPRLLILRLSSLGDILHTLPAAATLRASFPQARLDWVVEDRWKDLLELNPDVTNVIPVSTKAWRAALNQSGTWREVRRAVAALRDARYDAALDFQGLMKSALLARLSGARQRIGFDADAAKESAAAMFYTLHVRPPAGAHVVEMNLALARAAGAEKQVVKFPLLTRPEDEAYIEEQLRAQQVNDFFILSPGGGWGSKRWPLERYAQLHNALARERGWRSFLNTGPGEEALVEEFMREARVVKPAHFPLTLRQLVALVKRARLLVSGDSGPLHIAAAVGTPLVALFGPTDPLRNGPYGGRSVVIHHCEQAVISYKHEDTPSAAMLAITVEEVLAAIRRVLAPPSAGLEEARG
ncbi:MAG TPA: lipopolysaccharide heptosyltransferase I [Candidatus Xenobia bacterium]|nr:lipopolysaccharide heptosyltransferase I [Candidatus Xenobia bacterium]